MDIDKKNRTDLKLYFVKNAIPTESNFADLIDAMLNQKEDGIAKPAGNPLCIEATGDAGSLRKAINFYESFADANPAWAISLNPRVTPGDPNTAKPGFAISDPNGANRLFIDKTTGNVGIGTLAPGRVLEVSAADSNTGLKITGTDSQRSWLVTVGVVAGDGQLAFYDFGAAVQRLTIDKAGNVGIGTSTANKGKLDVRGMVGNTVGLFGDVGMSLVASWPNLGFNSYYNGGWKSISPGFAGNIDVNQSDGSMNFYLPPAKAAAADAALAPAAHLSIAASGNVGIGTTAPQAILHVEGPTELFCGGSVAGFSFANRNAPNNGARNDNPPAGQRWVWYSQDSIARLWTNTNGDRMYVNAAGFVGFGNPPAFPFDVRAAGRIKLGLEGMGGGQLQIACNPNDNSVFLEAYNAAGNASANVFWLTGMNSQPVPLMNLQANAVHISGSLTAGGGKGGYVMDQFVNAVDDTLEEGDVVVIGSNQASLYYGTKDGIPVPEADLTTRALDTRVCGIVCSVHGNVEPSETSKSGSQTRALTHEELQNTDESKVRAGQVGWMVTLGAYAHCKVDADIAPIEVGDLLATSPTKGHAQKVTGGAKAVGAILGKALGALSSGKGKIPVLVTLH